MISSTRRPHAQRMVYNRRHIDFAAGIIVGGLIGSISLASIYIEANKAQQKPVASTTSEQRICTPTVPATRTTLVSRSQ